MQLRARGNLSPKLKRALQPQPQSGELVASRCWNHHVISIIAISIVNCTKDGPRKNTGTIAAGHESAAEDLCAHVTSAAWWWQLSRKCVYSYKYIMTK